MKIRTGFVSNSSSSSFIVGIANKLDENGDFVFVPDRTQLPYQVGFKEISDGLYEVYISDFMDGKVTVQAKEGDNITYLDSTGYGDDSYFWNGNEYDYDLVNLDDFNTEDLAKYEEIKALGGEVRYGAGRDG